MKTTPDRQLAGGPASPPDAVADTFCTVALVLVAGFLVIFLYGVMRTLRLILACGLVVALWGLVAIFFIRGFERADDLGHLQIIAGLFTAAAGGLPSTIVMCRGIHRAVHASPPDGSPGTPNIQDDPKET